MNLSTIALAQEVWSRATLGPGARTDGMIAHMREELDELAADPYDVDELADLIILALDYAWRHGHSGEALQDAVIAKQRRNRARQWPEPGSVPDDMPIGHVDGC